MIANNRSSVRIWVRTGTLECALVSYREFDPRHDLAINFDTIESASIAFVPFLRGSNISNPVNMTLNIFRFLCTPIFRFFLRRDLALVMQTLVSSRTCSVALELVMYRMLH